MKSDDLERLEESQEMQQLIHAAKEQYEQEKSVHPPVAYAAFAQNLRERQKDGKMKAKQEPPERETFEVKGGKRSGISPWWPGGRVFVGWDNRLWDFDHFRQAGRLVWRDLL